MPPQRFFPRAAAFAAALFFLPAAAIDAAAQIKPYSPKPGEAIKPYSPKSGEVMPKKIKPGEGNSDADASVPSGAPSGEKFKLAPAAEAKVPKPPVFKGPKRVLAPSSVE